VNIFGGIVRCDKVAQGIADAARNLDISVPVIIRLSGSKSKRGSDSSRRAD
jgi:succinyl-CoA synthetase beta subunit